MQFARINDATLHFQTIGGPGPGPLLVFVNSLGTDFRIWRDIVVRLAGTYAVLLYDLRGHGLSDTGTTPYALGHHVDDLAGLLDHLGAKSAIVCGLSTGGQIALGLAASRPDLVRALLLCDTAHRIGDAPYWQARIKAIETGGLDGLADAILERWFSPAFRQSQPAALAGYRNMLVRQPVAGYLATCAALADADLSAAAARLEVPTLCLVGADDVSTPPALVATLAGLIPGARYEVIAAAGHLSCVEQPAAFVGLIRNFILTLGTEGAPHVTH